MAEKTKKTTGHPLKPPDAATTAGRSAIAASTEFSTAIDPSITRIAVELLRPEFHASDAAIQSGLQSLRELLSVDAVVVALFDDEMQVVQQTLASCTSRVGFTSALLLNEPIPGRTVLLERLGRQRLMEIRDLARPRNDHGELASCFARFNFGAILVAGIALRDRLAGFILIASARARSSWEVDAHLVLKLIAANYSAGLERMRLGKEFAYLQLRNELAMQSAHDGLWDYDLERNTLYLSPRWKAMLGYAADELIDVSDWRQFVHPDDAEQVESLLRAHLADELEYFESTHRVRHRSGE